MAVALTGIKAFASSGRNPSHQPKTDPISAPALPVVSATQTVVPILKGTTSVVP
jgi:hypothetical protein